MNMSFKEGDKNLVDSSPIDNFKLLRNFAMSGDNFNVLILSLSQQVVLNKYSSHTVRRFNLSILLVLGKR